jgi:LuxR family maltose regulon positive regulatory protein
VTLPSWFPLTKIGIPTTQTLFERPALVQQVRHATLSKRLTLISAPAGAGKSTVAAMAAHTTPPLPVAWLSLDREDNDPTTFWTGFILALQTLDPTIGEQALESLNAEQQAVPNFKRVVGGLVNDIMGRVSIPVVVVLDDVHTLTEARICEGLDYFLERMPPHLHILATARYDPPLALARLRGRGELADFRLTSLLFTLEETTRLLNEQRGLALSPAELTQVHTLSEGWIAGVRMLALSLDGIPQQQRTSFLHHITTQEHHVFDLLAEEVLAHQSPAMRQFLLETSILKEVTPTFCAIVTQRDDAKEMLRQLFRRNLFLIQITDDSDSGEATYRYHALFQTFLQEQLAREATEHVAVLHARIATQHPVPGRALYHYRCAHLWDEAATFIEQRGWSLFWQGRDFTLHEWLSWLPHTIRKQRPWLLLLQGFALYNSGDWTVSYQLMIEALAQFQAYGDKMGEWETIGAILGMADLMGAYDPQIARENAERILHEPLPPTLRARIYMGLAWWHIIYTEDWERANQMIEATMYLCRTHNDSDIYGAIYTSLSSYVWFVPNGRNRIVAFYREALERFGVQSGATSLWMQLTFADNDFWIGEVTDARRKGVQILEQLAELSTFHNLELNTLRLLAWATIAEKEYMFYDKVMTQMAGCHERPGGSVTYHTYFAIHAYGAWVRQEYDLLRRLRQHSVELRAANVPKDVMSAIGNQMTDALLLLAERKYAEAESLLRSLIKRQQTRRENVSMLADMRVPLAHLYLAQRRREEVLLVVEELFTYYEQLNAPGLLLKHGAALLPLLEVAQLSRRIRPFAETINRFLQGLREPRALHLPDSDERLTVREVEVLHLLARGSSNRDIADALTVTERTVKSHVTNIMSKLGVSSRGQAVARARELRLL